MSSFALCSLSLVWEKSYQLFLLPWLILASWSLTLQDLKSKQTLLSPDCLAPCVLLYTKGSVLCVIKDLPGCGLRSKVSHPVAPPMRCPCALHLGIRQFRKHPPGIWSHMSYKQICSLKFYEKGKKIIAAVTTEYNFFFYFLPEKSIRKTKDSSGFSVIQNKLLLSKSRTSFSRSLKPVSSTPPDCFFLFLFNQSPLTSYYRLPSDSLWKSLRAPMVVWIELPTKWLICLTCCLASESNHWEEIGFLGLCLNHGFIHWAFHNLITVLRDNKTSEAGPR